jgi:hypothetical protein
MRPTNRLSMASEANDRTGSTHYSFQNRDHMTVAGSMN